MCRPGSDQTERSLQRWQVVAPRLRKRLRFEHGTAPVISMRPPDSKIEGHLFSAGHSWGAWTKLAKATFPTIDASGSAHANAIELSLAVLYEPRTTIEVLPVELLALVLEDNVLTREDVLSLGLAFRNLWPHVLHHIATDCRKHGAPLAGVEIAVTGTYLTDLPPSFDNPDFAVPIKPSRIRKYGINRMKPARLFNWTVWSEWEGFDKEVGAAWMYAWEGPSSAKVKKSQAEKRLMLTQMMSVCSPNYGGSSDQIWVLRNLTTKEYVRCRPGRTMPVEHGYVDHVDVPDLKIDDALLMRIAWSRKSMSPTDVGVLDELVRGPWAGHCFDIIPLESAVHTEDSWNDWKDATNEIAEQVIQLAKHLKKSQRRLVWASEQVFGGSESLFGGLP
jgi:hypothetical protein